VVVISRFQKFMRQVRFMLGPYKPLKRPTFLVNDELEIRRAVARDLMGDTQVRPVLGKPIDYDDMPV
jgi:hypothetical protein